MLVTYECTATEYEIDTIVRFSVSFTTMGSNFIITACLLGLSFQVSGLAGAYSADGGPDSDVATSNNWRLTTRNYRTEQKTSFVDWFWRQYLLTNGKSL